MPHPYPYNEQEPAKEYDSRWFIWTIVFLVVTGLSLVSYILLSDSSTIEASGVVNLKSLDKK
jgi:hypothetical protein